MTTHRNILKSLADIADANPIAAPGSTTQTLPLEAAAAPETMAAMPSEASSPSIQAPQALEELLANIDRLGGLQSRLSHMLSDLEELVGVKSSSNT